MKVRIPKNKIPSLSVFISRLGYGRILDRREKQVSYARRLGGGLYPRFHLYIEESSENYILNLHLDQRPTRYAGVTAHAGEYDGGLVEREARRISDIR